MHRVDDVVLLPQGALWLPAERMLVVADLHVGYEEAAGAAGAALPSAPSPAEAVEAAVRLVSGPGITSTAESRVERIVVNGDVKHARAPLLAQARAVRALDERLARLARVTYVRGNHDAGLETILPHADIVDELRVGRHRVAHGHRGIARGPAILGHEHPIVALRDAVGARVRAPAFLHVDDAWVLPALSPWAAGVHVLAYGFSGPRLARADPREADAFLLDGEGVLAFGKLGALARAGLA